MLNKLTNIKRNVVMTAIVVLLGVMSVVETASAAQHWRFANLYGRGTAFGTLYEQLAKDIEKNTNGEVKVQVLYSGEGVGTSGLLGAAKSGLVTMIAPFQPMHAGEFPAGVVEVGLPGGTADTNKLYDIFHKEGFGDILKEAYASQGLVWLEPYIQPPVYIITKKPIKSVADFQGLKIRAPGAYGKFLRNLGASPVSLAWSEIYTSLATGVIDGSIGSNMIDHRDGNHVEVAKYMYRLPLAGAQVLPILVNKSAWNKLTDAQKKGVYDATVAHANAQLTMSKKWEQEAIAQMEAKGLQWSPEPSETDKNAWAKAGAGLWDEYAAKDKYSKQLIDVLRKTQDK
ncbi:TRAP transporter substrate-binding protein [Halarcobacter ebronensis]|uniref:C4-dicarboxylate ABC transporter substrate-binding protein n=1 Tax=Halarcobacter ebronensis TaxID=1462615 RepID=A0A4Q1AEB7_9BACT|nr:TRAP transporter substrate-binding protein [Halarcobacter ebronensis]QKF83041.1 TRAP transporter, substrate binding protein, DctP family [Halarcobacter ebronensis]QKF83043.1 TRAP transporter, substrate binding protein, DctP family [Halarcobacter ebronensis]RXK00860.1 C4-dicarboxylate ABC transporter substrate-binding protein [Halarcobacter ebronensis]RXK00862.1 C4-dicarboxylate ABC transporter substrate-binding protein [Halarcobacter ebronensis]